MKMIFCIVLIIAAVCIAALVCYVVSGKVLQEKIKERDTKKVVLARKSKRWHEKALTPPTIEIVGFLGDAARFIAKPCLKQRVMRFPTIRYGCSAQ